MRLRWLALAALLPLSCNSILATPLEDVVKGDKRPQDDVLRLAEVLGI